MAHVFYADKHPKKNSSDSDDRWANRMGFVFTFMEKWNQYRIYNAFNWIPLRIANGIGGIAGKIALKSSKSYEKKLKRSYYSLFPENANLQGFHKFRKAYSAYLGKLVFSFLGGLTTKNPPPIVEFASYQNLELLDRELLKGKGVIVPITHLGELTQVIWAILKHPKKYTVATVVYVPHMGIYKYANHPYYDNVYFYASTSFRLISKYLQQHLQQNHIVMIYYDFGHPNQFRAPFWHQKYPYLLYTPQSIIRLHQKTGASILPCINLPDEVIGKTILKFVENSDIMRLSEQLKAKSNHEFYGALSMELNRTFAPYLKANAHVWEQFLDFNIRISDSFKISANLSLIDLLDQIHLKLLSIIENSYEPGRPDEKIIEFLKKFEQSCKKQLINPLMAFRDHNSFMDLTGLSAIKEIEKILLIFSTEFQKLKENVLADIFIDALKKFQEICNG